MTPRRTELLSLLSSLDQADAATTQLLKLDAGPPVDSLAEGLANMVEEMRMVVQDLMRE